MIVDGAKSLQRVAVGKRSVFDVWQRLTFLPYTGVFSPDIAVNPGTAAVILGIKDDIPESR